MSTNISDSTQYVLNGRNSFLTPSGLKHNPKGKVYDQVIVPFLRTNRKASYVGTTGDLFTILSEGTPQYSTPPKLPKWDYSKPTVSSYVDLSYTDLNWLNRDMPEKMIDKKPFLAFEKILAGPIWFKEVTKFVKDTPGLIMAGGYVVNCYLKLLGCKTQRVSCQDIDLFLTGQAASSPEKASEVVTKLEKIYFKCCDSLMNFLSSRSRTVNCINFYIGDNAGRGSNNIAQVILRLYNHPSEVLHGFDLGSCQLAYDGKDVFTTSAGLLAIKMGINVVDMTRRRDTYEKRLLKYVKRGFKIVFPNLSPASLKCKKIETPYFTLYNKDTIYFKDVTLFRPSNDEGMFGEAYTGRLESYQILAKPMDAQKHNVRNYINHKYHGIEPYYLILSNVFGGKYKEIVKDYVKLKYDSQDDFYDRIINDKTRYGVRFDPLRINLLDMKDYFTPSIIEMFVKPIMNGKNHNSKLKAMIINEVKALREEIEKEFSKITIPLVWRSSGDDNDLNACFGIDRVPVDEWYGKHYVPIGWDETKFKYYSQEVKDSIQTIMFVRNRVGNGVSSLPMEVMFHIFGYLVPEYD
uniref:Uncharacterized protein n=1 Tax=Pithovirus LCPAC202 TaxID=2506592 RepID=A0A481Z6U0_9VIRU|nr:MAG: hypothetical protein LCPAC202_03000 [Pithovirus LCPAC202]